MAQPASQAVTRTKRDPRIDVMRGISLLMIFADHIPNNLLSAVTLHNFAFSDAAETFVLLAGFSATLAYGKLIERNGWRTGITRIAQRCLRIYVAQVALVFATFFIVKVWTYYFPFPSTVLARILEQPVAGLFHAVLLAALPSYLNILPLYLVLLGSFPLVYLVLRRSMVLALALSTAIWLFGSIFTSVNLPNWVDHQGWYFDPLCWQFLFVIGAVLARWTQRRDGDLPFNAWLAAGCVVYLAAGALESIPWHDWHLTDLRPWALAPMDKSHLAWPRVVSILAQMYLIMSSRRIRAIAGSGSLRAMEWCGKHSLEVFSVGCLCALLGRLSFRTIGSGPAMQILVNVTGIALMILCGWYLEHGRRPRQPAALPRVSAA